MGRVSSPWRPDRRLYLQDVTTGRPLSCFFSAAAAASADCATKFLVCRGVLGKNSPAHPCFYLNGIIPLPPFKYNPGKFEFSVAQQMGQSTSWGIFQISAYEPKCENCSNKIFAAQKVMRNLIFSCFL